MQKTPDKNRRLTRHFSLFLFFEFLEALLIFRCHTSLIEGLAGLTVSHSAPLICALYCFLVNAAVPYLSRDKEGNESRKYDKRNTRCSWALIGKTISLSLPLRLINRMPDIMAHIFVSEIDPLGRLVCIGARPLSGLCPLQ